MKETLGSCLVLSCRLASCVLRLESRVSSRVFPCKKIKKGQKINKEKIRKQNPDLDLGTCKSAEGDETIVDLRLLSCKKIHKDEKKRIKTKQNKTKQNKTEQNPKGTL